MWNLYLDPKNKNKNDISYAIILEFQPYHVDTSFTPYKSDHGLAIVGINIGII